MEQKDSRAKRAGKSVANFLNRVNRGENERVATKQREREKLMEIAADAGMTYATRGTNKIAQGAPKKAKGGTMKNKAYITETYNDGFALLDSKERLIETGFNSISEAYEYGISNGFDPQPIAGLKMAKGGKLKGMKKIRLKKSFSDKYMPGVTHIYFDKNAGGKYYFLDFEGDPMRLRNKYTLEELKKEGYIMAKGGTMKKDDKWIQSTVKEMEKKGTVGLFTKKAKRRGMTTQEFMREVLRNPKKYTLKTRREAQWMANVTGDEYEKGGKLKVELKEILIEKFKLKKGDYIDNGVDLYVVYKPEIKKFLDENLEYPHNSNYEHMTYFTDKISKRRYIDIPQGVNKRRYIDIPRGAKKKFAKGGSIDEETLVVDVVWKQLDEKGLGKFNLKESDVERLEDNYGSTYYFEIYDDTNEKPISYTKMKNILDKSMKDMGLMDSYYAKGGTMKKQGYNDKLDESLGNRKGKESTKKQSLKDRRDESKGEEKALGKRAYSSVSTMDELLPFLSWHKK